MKVFFLLILLLSAVELCFASDADTVLSLWKAMGGRGYYTDGLSIPGVISDGVSVTQMCGYL
jgi:hypothetical protein